MDRPWFQRTYRRLLLDMHIADWDESFLSKFDPQGFVDNLVLANVSTAMLDANSHSGLCYWPTRVGQMHRGIKGRDLVGELIRLCHGQGMEVVLYYCTIYVGWYSDQHPQARTVDADGRTDKVSIGSVGRPKRFSTCCPNNPQYRDFVVAQLRELGQEYDFEGIWPDMTFWPRVCYCPACRERYAAEAGGEMPTIVNWADPTWVRFQRKRQAWISEFAHLVTATIKEVKPGTTVAHQAIQFCNDWRLGASLQQAKASDWMSADLYGDKHVLSSHSKLFYGLSERKPFEHLNTWCYPRIIEHVVTRSEEHVKAVTFSTLMNHGAMAIIDAVDPIGTTNRDRYLMGGRVFREVERYEPHIGGRFCQDVAIYFSYDSDFDLAENGQRVTQIQEPAVPNRSLALPSTHRAAALNVAGTLLQHHIPFGVITQRNLSELSDYQIVILPNVMMLDEEELAALRAYVRAGGSLYASKYTSLITKEGEKQPDFALAELLGASYTGETEEIVTYVAPEAGQEGLFPGYSAEYPVTLYDTQVKASRHEGAVVLARLVLPYTDPQAERYASILTDAPGIATGLPSIILNRYGKGQVLYAAGVLELGEHESQRRVLMNLLRLLATRPFHFQTDAPGSVEVTLFEQSDRQRYVLNLLNFQEELPNIPIEGLKVQVWMEGRAPVRVVELPEGRAVEYTVRSDYVELTISRLETFSMLAIEYA